MPTLDRNVSASPIRFLSVKVTKCNWDYGYNKTTTEMVATMNGS